MFKKLKIGTKLISGFILVALIAAYIGFTGYRSVVILEDGSKKIYENIVIPLEQLKSITEFFQRVRVNLRDMIHADTKERVDYFIKRTQGIVDQIDKESKAFEKRILGGRMRKAYNHFLQTRKDYHVYMKQIYAFARNNEDEKAYKVLLGTGFKAANAEKKAIEDMSNFKVEDGRTLFRQNVEAGRSAELQVILFGVLGFVLALVLGFFLSKSISDPLVKGVAFANTIASKDLTSKLDKSLLERQDEIGQLSNALNSMQENLAIILAEMNDVASNLAASSEEISSSSQSMAEGAQNQSASVEETSSSIEELSSSVTQVAGNADDVRVKSQDLLGTAEQSSVLVENAVEGMNKINESSQKISEILTVINDIADQTNLLALNAAIEAARAGEHGRGFAVVADEISKLADKSTENSKQIEQLIKQSIKDVSEGADIVGKAGDAFNQIISGINENNKLVEGISEAVTQQKDGAEQVSQAVENINDVTQNVSASAEEMAASTEELQSQAEKIAIMVGDFKIEEQENKAVKSLELHKGESKE